MTRRRNSRLFVRSARRHRAYFARAVLNLRNVVSRHSRAGLVRGCPHPDGGLANLETATIRSNNLDLLGLRRAPWHVGNVGRYSFHTNGGISMGETPNFTVGSLVMDRWLGTR